MRPHGGRANGRANGRADAATTAARAVSNTPSPRRPARARESRRLRADWPRPIRALGAPTARRYRAYYAPRCAPPRRSVLVDQRRRGECKI